MPTTTINDNPPEAPPALRARIYSFTVRTVPILLGVFVFLMPFSLDTSVKEICFYTAAGLCAISMTGGHLRIDLKTPVAIPFLVFVVWAIVSIPFTLNTPNTVNDIYAHLIKYLVLSYMVAHFFSSRSRFIVLSWLVVASGTIYTLWYLAYFFLYLDKPWGARFVLFPYRDYIYVFSFLVAAGHLLYTRRAAIRVVAVGAMAVLLTATVISQTRNAMLATGVGIIVMSPRKKRTLGLIAAVAILAFAVSPTLRQRFTGDDVVRNERLSINWTTFNIIRDYPVFGIGFGMQTYGNRQFIDLEKYHEMVPERYRYRLIFEAPHNLLADVAVRTGVVGLGIFLWILGAFARMLIPLTTQKDDPFVARWALCSTACASAFLTQSMFGDATYDLQALVFYTNLAMAVILWRMRPPCPATPHRWSGGCPRPISLPGDAPIEGLR